MDLLCVAKGMRALETQSADPWRVQSGAVLRCRGSLLAGCEVMNGRKGTWNVCAYMVEKHRKYIDR